MKKATSFDIAYMAGVSQSTVSRALSDSPLVNKATRDRIKQIAKDINYKVDKNASNLRKQKSSTIALLLFEDPTNDDSLINPFFISMLASITKACAAAGYDLLVSFQNLNDDWDSIYNDSHKADGLILLGYGDYTDYEHKLRQLKERGTHFIRWGAPDVNYPGVTIGSDNFEGGRVMARHLLKLGHRKFAFIGNANDGAPELLARFNGFTSEVINFGLPPENLYQIDAITTEAAGYDATCQLLNLYPQYPDAIFCASDSIAVGSLRALRESLISVPEQIAVVGYDDIPIGQFVSPTLTTMHQNTQEAGALMVKNLLSMIDGVPAADLLIQPSLIIRRSCGNNG